MDLTEAFGAAFKSARVPAARTVPTVSSEFSAIQKPEPRIETLSSTGATLGSTVAETPEVYVLNVEIGKDECHLICVFLLVFSLSFILSNRK